MTLGDSVPGTDIGGPRARRAKAGPSSSGNSAGMALLMAMPWLMFTMIVIAFSFAYHHYTAMVWGLVVTMLAASLIYMVLEMSGRMGGQWFIFLGILGVVAVIFSTLAGLYNYHTHMFQYWSYDENRSYTNVLPSEPAAAHGDAGKMVFANTARVDTTRAVGYKAGTTYCVAPILDDSQLDRVEYWAAGIDCCPSRGDFVCDDAWNPTAKSGVVILDSDSFFPAKRDYYLKAVAQASSAFQMTSAEEPLLVRWVSDPQQIQDDYWRGGVGFLLAIIFIYLLISIVLGAMLFMFSKRTAGGQAAAGGQPAQAHGGNAGGSHFP